MKKWCILLSCIAASACQAQGEKKEAVSKEVQIKIAVMALPEKDRAGATVYGYQPDGSLTVIRAGDNDMICLSDNPEREGISVSCYPKSLEPFMARGRALTAEGKNFEERSKIRGDEIASGKLSMPKDPVTLSVYFGEEYDPETGGLKDAKMRYVVYTPYATARSTGLPDTPQPGGRPWLMDAGTHRAHIMIGPFKLN